MLTFSPPKALRTMPVLVSSRCLLALVAAVCLAGCGDDAPPPPVEGATAAPEGSLVTRIAPPTPPAPLLPTADEARAAVAAAFQGASEAGTTGGSYPPDHMDTQLQQLIVDACWPTTPGEAICRATVGDRSLWLRFQRDGQAQWGVAGIAPPPS